MQNDDAAKMNAMMMMRRKCCDAFDYPISMTPQKKKAAPIFD